jgi:MATE family multidrug resistance protein
VISWFHSFALKFNMLYHYLKTLAKQAVPTSITTVRFATGMTALYWIVSHLGTAEVAAVNVLINLMLTLVLPCMGMGLAAGALSGRALGRGDVEDATQWPWDVAKLTAAMMFGVGLIAVGFPEKLLGCFLTNQDAISKAVMPLRFTGITVVGLYGLNSVYPQLESTRFQPFWAYKVRNWLLSLPSQI